MVNAISRHSVASTGSRWLLECSWTLYETGEVSNLQICPSTSAGALIKRIDFIDYEVHSLIKISERFLLNFAGSPHSNWSHRFLWPSKAFRSRHLSSELNLAAKHRPLLSVSGCLKRGRYLPSFIFVQRQEEKLQWLKFSRRLSSACPAFNALYSDLFATPGGARKRRELSQIIWGTFEAKDVWGLEWKWS